MPEPSVTPSSPTGDNIPTFFGSEDPYFDPWEMFVLVGPTLFVSLYDIVSWGTLPTTSLICTGVVLAFFQWIVGFRAFKRGKDFNANVFFTSCEGWSIRVTFDTQVKLGLIPSFPWLAWLSWPAVIVSIIFVVVFTEVRRPITSLYFYFRYYPAVFVLTTIAGTRGAAISWGLFGFVFSAIYCYKAATRNLRETS